MIYSYSQKMKGTETDFFTFGADPVAIPFDTYVFASGTGNASWSQDPITEGYFFDIRAGQGSPTAYRFVANFAFSLTGPVAQDSHAKIIGMLESSCGTKTSEVLLQPPATEIEQVSMSLHYPSTYSIMFDEIFEVGLPATFKFMGQGDPNVSLLGGLTTCFIYSVDH